MSKSLSRIAALDEISNWSNIDVLSLLRKNGLEDCCKAVQKRQVDGDDFLHLTEGKLALWKSDLSRPLTWSLWRFVEELKKSPEKYVAEKKAQRSQSEETMSDSGSWGTDFEDDVDEDSTNDVPSEVPRHVTNNNNNNNELVEQAVDVPSNNPEFHNNLMLFRENERLSLNNGNRSRISGIPESTYTNCESDVDPPIDETTYANCSPNPKTLTAATKNVSNLHAKYEKNLAEQLKEQLKLRSTRKPTIGPKPEVSIITKVEKFGQPRRQPQKSFLHDVIPGLQQQQQQVSSEKSVMSAQTEPEKLVERTEADLPRPPVMIRNFDLVANLPTRTEESEDEYETFDEQIIEQNLRLSIAKVDSKQSLDNLRQNSVESLYKTQSTTSEEKPDEEYEIYESITETPEDNGYYRQPVAGEKIVVQAPPPLPLKPANAPAISSSAKPRRIGQDEERSPDKKSATLPHPASGTSLSAGLRATRPLPPPPNKQSYMDSPWFHNVTREQATALIKDRAYSSPRNGYFLLRPSTSHPNNPLALVLWFRDRVYNVPVRKRPDNRYALGSAKVNEQSFASVEEIVKFYSREELVLYTGGVQTGSTKLMETPPK